jgi:hypothetical protein
LQGQVLSVTCKEEDVKNTNWRTRPDVSMTRKRFWSLLSFVLVVLAGCRYGEHQVTFNSKANIPQVEGIESYLVDHLGVPAWDGKVFCLFANLNADQVSEGYVYLWALCLQYHMEGTKPVIGAGTSVPVALQVQQESNDWIIVDYLVPRDGSFFGTDVHNVFPKRTWDQILPGSRKEIDQKNNLVEDLKKDIELKAQTYFGI